MAQLLDVARRAPPFPVEPGAAGVAPPARLVVAAVLDELTELLPADGLGVDLELGHRLVVRPALGRRHEAAALAAQAPGLRAEHDRIAQRAQHALSRQQRAHRGDALRLRQRGEAQHERVLREHRGTEDVQRIVVVDDGAGGQQVERRFERLGQVGTHDVGRRWCGVGRRHLRPPGIGQGLDRRQRRPRIVARRAAGALHVACDPALLPPAGVAGQPPRRRQAVGRALRGVRFQRGQPGQRAVAGMDQRQRQQLAVGMAHRLRIVQRGVGAHRPIVRDGRPASTKASQPSRPTPAQNSSSSR